MYSGSDGVPEPDQKVDTVKCHNFCAGSIDDKVQGKNDISLTEMNELVSRTKL